jgi:hypothetical protein
MEEWWDDGEDISESIDEAVAALLAIGEPIPADVLWEIMEPASPCEQFTARLQADSRVRINDQGWVELCSIHVIHRSRPGTRRARVSIMDRLFDVLKSHGEPMLFSVLSDSDDHRLSDQRLKSRLSSDARFMRTDRDTYGLTEWGLEPYDSVIGLMKRSIERQGGVASIADIVTDLKARFTVNERSIRTFAQTDAFVKVGRGRLRVRGADEHVEEQEEPTSASRDCVVIDRRWAFRVAIDERILSGFSVKLPAGFGRALGVRRNEYRRVDAVGGHSLGVSRKSTQDSLGRLRHVVEWLGLEAGDLLFVIAPAHPSDEIEFRAERFEELAEMTVEARVAALLGLRTKLDATGAAVALGMNPNSSPAAVVATLRRRGEEDLADDLASVIVGRTGSRDSVNADDIADALGW